MKNFKLLASAALVAIAVYIIYANFWANEPRLLAAAAASGLLLYGATYISREYEDKIELIFSVLALSAAFLFYNFPLLMASGGSGDSIKKIFGAALLSAFISPFVTIVLRAYIKSKHQSGERKYKLTIAALSVSFFPALVQVCRGLYQFSIIENDDIAIEILFFCGLAAFTNLAASNLLYKDMKSLKIELDGQKASAYLQDLYEKKSALRKVSEENKRIEEEINLRKKKLGIEG